MAPLTKIMGVGYKCGVDYLWFDLGPYRAGTCFEVSLRGSAANVCLLTAENYQLYVDGEEFEYHGGFQDVSPCVLEVPYDDHWYLVVDDYEGRIKVTYEEVLD